MIDNPFCAKCNKHGTIPNHKTKDHEKAFERKKEKEPESVSMVVSPEVVVAAALWCGGVQVVEHDALDHSKTFPAINVPTNHGPKRARQGDTIMRKEDGSFDVIGQG